MNIKDQLKTMNNMFKGAKFGDKYETADGREALFLGWDDLMKTVYLYVKERDCEFYGEDRFNLDGTCFSGSCKHDIIGVWKKEEEHEESEARKYIELKIVSYEQAESLRKLGFPCSGYQYSRYFYVINSYTSTNEFVGDVELNKGDLIDTAFEDIWLKHENLASAPGLELAIKWLGEEKKIYIFAIPLTKNPDAKEISVDSWEGHIAFDGNEPYTNERTSRDECFSDCINKAIELLS